MDQNFETFPFFYWFQIRYRKIWYRKKYQIQYRKNLVTKKVSDSVSEKFGLGKKFRIWFLSDFVYRHTLLWIEKLLHRSAALRLALSIRRKILHIVNILQLVRPLKTNILRPL